MVLCFFSRCVSTCSVDDILSTAFTPGDIFCLTLEVAWDFPAVDDESLVVSFDLASKLPECRIILQHISHIIIFGITIIDTANLDIRIVCRDTDSHSADSSETVQS